MQTPRIIHTGQALVDQVMTVDGLPTRGGNAVAHHVELLAGGAVNVLLAAARQRARCVLAGSVGKGPRGDLIRATLAAEQVAISSPTVQELDTGVCVVLVEPQGERTFVTSQGAERRISVESLASAEPVPGDLICVSGYTLQGPTRAPLLAWLTGLPDHVQVVLDPGAAFADVDRRTRKAMLAVTTIWSSNAAEALDLCGEAEMVPAAGAIAALLPAGAAVVVRDGPAGCAVHVDGLTTEVPGYPQQAIDTNGAGDAHTGVLLANLSAGLGWIAAAQRANAAGAIKVTRMGPATAPDSSEIDAFLANVPSGR